MHGAAFDRVEGRGLMKVFGPTRALAGVDVSFSAGTVTCVEGPNGSGKSTLLSLLALLARPTRGELRFGKHTHGQDAGTDLALRARIGVLAHAPMVYPDLTAHENLAFYAQLHGLRTDGPEVAAMVDRFGLGAWAQRPCRTYSRGQLQRVGLARALLHAPTLLLLDEPSTGLDDASTQQLLAAVKQERERGAMVVVVTHDRAFSEHIADRRIQLRQGRVVEEAA
jgi:heme ABC exporter ATP-binding subunit CcmA